METTRELDGTGLYYYRARYYHPTLSRFISEDPIEYAAGANVYAYVGGDPVRRVDPYGEDALEIVGGLAALNASTPDPTDAAWPKWAGWGAALAAAAAVDMVCEKSSNKKKGKDAADDPPNGGHDNGKRPSTKDKHEKGDERRIRDQGREKKEERMKY